MMRLEEAFRDLSVAVRVFGRSPGYASVVVVTLGLGIGANTLIVSLMNPYLIRALPFADADRLVQIGQIDRAAGWDTGRFSLPMLLDWESRSQSFEEVGAYYYRTKNVTGNQGPERVIAGVLHGSLFELLGVGPRLGRTFGLGEEGPGGEDVVVLSDGLWRRRYGGDPTILGREILLDDSPFTVIGVMPPAFNFPFGGVKLWIPSREDPVSEARDRDLFIPVARLRPDVSSERAKEELLRIQRELAAIHPDVDGRFDGVSLKPMREALNFAYEPMRMAFAVLLAAVAFVLVIACVNVTSLALAREGLIRRDVAVRAALGASRARLVRQLLTESFLLALAGGAVGVFVAFAGARAIGPLIPEDLFRVGDVRVDGSVLLASMLLTLATPLIFGLAPALSASRLDLATALAQAGRGSTGGRSSLRFRRGLVVAEIAMALVLVAGTGLMLRSFLKLGDVDLGFRSERLLTIEVTLPESEYGDSASQNAYFDRATSKLRSLNGVRSAGTVTPLPMNHAIWTVSFAPPGSAPALHESWPLAHEFRVAPGALEAMGVALVSGRGIESSDGPSARRVVLVSASLAARFFPERPAVGETLLLADGGDEELVTIVGVTADVVHDGFTDSIKDDRPNQIYRPLAQSGSRGRFFVVQTSGPPETMAADAKRALGGVDPNLPLTLRTMNEIVRESALEWSLSALLLGVFGAVAVALASLGIFGLVACSVAARRREIGLRMALGATTADVRKAILGEGLRLGALGLIIGLVLAGIAGRLMASVLFHVTPFDPVTIVGVVLLFLVVPLVASLVPATRAARTDPIAVLRFD